MSEDEDQPTGEEEELLGTESGNAGDEGDTKENEETENPVEMTAEEIEATRIEAEKEVKRNERLDRERPANLARVDFRPAVVKDIVSHHAGSILAHDGPVVPLTDEMLIKAREVFKELAITFEGAEGKGEGEVEGGADEEAGDKKRTEVASVAKTVPPPVLEARKLSQALFMCGATPVNVDSMTELTGVSGAEEVSQTEEEEQAGETQEGEVEGEGEGEGEEGLDGEASVASAVKSVATTSLNPMRDRRKEILKKAIALFYDSNSLRSGAGSSSMNLGGANYEEKKDDFENPDVPEGSMDEGTFLAFLSSFYAPSYNYGQRLRRFVARGCVDDALLLLARGCNVNTSDGEGLSPLHYASEFNKTEMIQALYAFAKEGLKVNAKDKAGWTPLYCAVHHGNIEVVELLLSAPFNCNIAASTILGKSPLHAAAGQRRLAIADVLLNSNADASQRDFKGMTPLHDAAYKSYGDLYELLSQHPTCSMDAKEELGYLAEQFLTEATGVSAKK